MAIKQIGFCAFILSCFLLIVPGMAQKARIVVQTTVNLVDATLPPFNQVHPGDTLYFQPGTRSYLLIRNFQGDQENPVTFINLDGVVIIDTDHYYGITLENCRFIRFTGTGTSDQFYGFKIQRVLGGGGIGIGDMSSDVEIDHFYIENVPIGGIYAKTDPDCSFLNSRDKFTQYNTIIHDNYIGGVGNEGLYIGSSKYFGQVVNCNGVDTLLLPPLLDGVKIYSNIIHYSGWDGIQVSSASNNCQVYDNLIMSDSQEEQFGQMSGILLGGGSNCDCFNNYIENGKGNGIESHGLGGYRIFNNIIVNAGKTFKPSDSTQMKHGIYVSDVSVLQDSSFCILFNNIINPKSDGIRFSSTLSRQNLVASNAVINPGNFDYYEHGHTGFTGHDSYVMVPNATTDVLITNNYFSRTTDSAGFSPTGYTLLPGSVLIDSGYVDNKGITFDFYHHARPYGSRFDIGAHEYNPAYLDIFETQRRPSTKITIYPNPVRESFSLRFSVKETSVIILYIYTLQGDLAEKQNLGIADTGIHTICENAASLPDGIYLFILRIGNESHSGRFIKTGLK